MIKQNQQTYEELTSEFTESDEELRKIEKKFNQVSVHDLFIPLGNRKVRGTRKRTC